MEASKEKGRRVMLRGALTIAVLLIAAPAGFT